MGPLDFGDEHDLLERTASKLAEHVRQSRARARPIERPGSPEELAAGLRDANSLDTVIEFVLERSVATNHPRFFNQNFAGPDPVAIAGDWLTSVLNTNVATFEMAPVITVMEYEMLAVLARRVGWREDDETVARPRGTRPGVFVPGGSMAILHAMVVARHRVQPEIGDHGSASLCLAGQLDRPLCLFTSAQAHYSLGKSAMALGLGRRHVHAVEVDAHGRMRPDALRAEIEAALERGEQPFFVNATAGTTVTGAFDPIDEIADLGRRHGMWLHVDGCFGASALMSDTHRALLSGAERADSLSWNPHKMMGMTQQCSALLLREPEQLREVFAGTADYLFQDDKPYADLDGGDLTLSCARRADAVKLWLSHAAHGVAGFGARIDRAYDHARELEARVVDDERFALAVPANPFNVCFWWIPPELRPFELDVAPPHALDRLGALTTAIKGELGRRGEVMVGYAPLPGRPPFFRMLFMNPDVTSEDIDALLDELDTVGSAVA